MLEELDADQSARLIQAPGEAELAHASEVARLFSVEIGLMDDNDPLLARFGCRMPSDAASPIGIQRREDL